MPTFLIDQLGFSTSTAGALSTVPYAALFVVTLVSGHYFTYCLKELDWSVRAVRLSAQFISLIGASCGLLLCGYLSNVSVAYACMVFTQAFLGILNSGYTCSYLDIAPYYSGLLNSIAVMVGAAAGVLGPIIVSMLTSAYSGVMGWRYVFFISVIQCAFALGFWYVYQRSELVHVLNTPLIPTK